MINSFVSGIAPAIRDILLQYSGLNHAFSGLDLYYTT